MQGMLQRQITEKLQSTIAQVPAVALLGARQVGKTPQAKTIAKDIDSIYLDLEAPEGTDKLTQGHGLALHKSGSTDRKCVSRPHFEFYL